MNAADWNSKSSGEAADGIAARDVWEKLSPPEIPDLVILDNSMPGRDGIEVAAEMLARQPRQQIVIFSAHLTSELEHRAAQLGVVACVAKNDSKRLLQLVAEIAAR